VVVGAGFALSASLFTQTLPIIPSFRHCLKGACQNGVMMSVIGPFRDTISCQASTDIIFGVSNDSHCWICFQLHLLIKSETDMQTPIKVQVLGVGCPKCKTLEENIRQLVATHQLNVDVEKITDFKEIMKYGIMSTPGLVNNGVVKSVGLSQKILTLTMAIKVTPNDSFS
jgi:small redox-active disulfide protein 2